LERCISKVEALDPATLEKWSPKVDAVQASVDDTLARTFGHDTVEYKRYHRDVNWAAHIPSFGGETTLEQFRQDVAKGKAEVLAMLGQAVESLQEQLAEHGMTGAPSAAPTGGVTVAIAHPTGTKVIIGHGRSPLWRELKDFIKDRLHLPVEEFNSVPTAGVTTVARVEEMLDSAMFAFLIMTAEDEQPDGKVRARENVVHEVGLFQGRLSFKRAIVLLEEGCGEFSNIQGLGQIRFPKGNITAKFEDVRQVLEREGIKAP
jgi:predicted nucleotide-binding protein